MTYVAPTSASMAALTSPVRAASAALGLQSCPPIRIGLSRVCQAAGATKTAGGQISTSILEAAAPIVWPGRQFRPNPLRGRTFSNFPRLAAYANPCPLPQMNRCGVRQLPHSGGVSMVRRLTHTEPLMLLQFRNITKGWIATIIVGLVGLATVLFLIPQDGFNLVGDNSVAHVGNRSITPPQLTRELELTLRSERENGNNISQQDAVDQGIHLQLLERMINRVAMYVYGDKIGVSASDTQVRDQINRIPAVHNAVTGAFDQTAYDAFLGQMRYNQQEFERDVRGDLTTQMIVQSLLAGVRAPSSYGALTYAYDAETRVVSLAEIPASVVGANPTT